MENIVVGSKECPVRTVWSILINGYQIKKKWSEFSTFLNVSSDDTAKFLRDQLVNKTTVNDTLKEILNDWVRRQGNNATLAELIRVVEDECEDTDVGEQLRVAHNLPWRNFQTSTTWATLPPTFRKKVEQNIPQLLPNISMETVKCKVSGEILFDLMTGKKPKLFNSIIPPRPTFYLNRTVLPRHIISEKVFDEDANDIFLFTDINEFGLGRLVRKHETSTSGKQLDSSEIYVRFMVSEQRNHFKEIGKKTSAPIHLISVDSDLNKLKWIQTRGCVRLLQRFIDDSQNPLTEEQFLQSVESNPGPILISDSPGMGKSFFLSKIAFELEKAGGIVIFTSVSDFIKQIKANCSHDKIIINAIEATLQNLVCNNELAISEFNDILSSSSHIKIDLLMDGFDEVSIELFAFAMEILKTLSASFKSIRFWVTTRLHHLEELEEEFSVLGYNIKGFDDDDQVHFLKSHWQRSNIAGDNQRLNPAKLRDYAGKVLQTIKFQLNKDDNDIAGIPLQCLLIAEVFEEECIGFVSGSNDIISDPKIRINSISDLYTNMVANKFEKYIKTFTDSEFAGYDNLLAAHVDLSLHLLFPYYRPNLDFIRVNIKDLLNIGILQASGSASPDFIHRTFAEYFVAGYVVEKLLGEEEVKSDVKRDEFIRFLLDQVLMRNKYILQIFREMGGITSYKFVHRVIVYFVNTNISLAINSKQKPTLLHGRRIELETKEQIYHACANSSFLQIFKLILNYDYSDINETIILLTIRNSSCEFFKTIMACLAERIGSFGEQNLSNFIRLAVQRSDVEIIEFLIKTKVFDFRQFIENVNASTKLLLHDCVSSTKYKAEDDIKKRASVIKLLVEVNPLLLEARDCFERTPLLCEYAHVDLLRELVRLGADIYSQDELGDTVLHLSKDQTRRLNALEYHSLLTSISQSRLDHLLNITGQDENIPLIRLLSFIDPTEETLRMLHSGGTASLQMAFKVAIENGRNRHTLKSLIDFGVDLFWKGKYGQGYLHIAAHNGNIDALNLLVQDNRVDVNILDDRLQTPMDYLIASNVGSSKENKRFETAIALYKLGGRMGEEFSSKQENILLQAITDGNSQSVRIIECIRKVDAGVLLKHDFGEDSERKGNYLSDEKFKLLVKDFRPSCNFYRDENGNSILHLAVQRGDEQAVKELIAKGADLDDRNFSRDVPLHRACWCRDVTVGLRIIKLLIDNGASVYAKNEGTYTFLHALTKEDLLNPIHFHDITEYLFRKDLLDLLSVSSDDGVTPLHRACVSLEIEEKTILLIYQKGISFNQVDDEGDNVLTYAISGSRSKDFLSLLIHKCDADWKHRDKSGNTALHVAAEHGHTEAMTMLMNMGLEVNLVNEDGDTPLHRVAEFGEGNILEAAKILVEAGVGVSKRDQSGKTALHLALERSVDNIFSSVIRKEFAKIVGGSELQIHSDYIEKKMSDATRDDRMLAFNLEDGKGRNHSSLHKAVLEIDDIDACVDMIKSLLSTGADANAKDEYGYTFLHKLLLEKEISPLKFQQFVEYLCSNEHTELLRTPGGKKRVTILHLCVSHIQPTRKTLQLFKTHEINLNTLDVNGNSVLAYSIFGKRDPTFLEMLIDDFGVSWRSLNKAKQNLVHIAAKRGNEATIRFFVNRGLDINLPDSNGHTPIFRAVRCNQEEKGLTFCQLLLELGADITQKTTSGENLLHMSAGFGPAKVVQLFLEFGFDPNEPDNVGRTPLHFVAYRQDDKTPIVKYLIENGAVPNAIDEKGCTPLDYAVRHEFQSLSLITCLIDNGADFDNSFLHYSAKYGGSQNLKFFLDKKVLNVNAVNMNGDTPLHCALQQKESENVLEKVQMLLEYGASLDIRNKRGQTPLNIIDERDEWNEIVKSELKFLITMALAIMLWKKLKHES